MQRKKLRVVTIGGGGGHAQVLKALKSISDIIITAICPSTDSGGSTGVLQREYNAAGYLGDLTKCFAALCSDELLAKTLLFRYSLGCLNGHSIKNMLFLGLEQIGGLDRALSTMARICELGEHRVIPVTAAQTKLCATLKVGNRIHGETQIDKIAQNPLWNPSYHAIQSIFLDPRVPASKQACSAVTEADWSIICPGDLYSSILPVVLPDGMSEAFYKSESKVVVVLNIMTKQGETDNYRAMDFVVEIEKRLGRACDVILANKAPLPGNLLIEYALEQKVQLDPTEAAADNRVRLAELVKVTAEGFLYHDPAKLTSEFVEIFSRVEV